MFQVPTAEAPPAKSFVTQLAPLGGSNGEIESLNPPTSLLYLSNYPKKKRQMLPLFDNIVHKQHRNMLKLQKQKTRRLPGLSSSKLKRNQAQF